MTAETASSDIARTLAETTRRQALAADPEASVWVSANAGTGKTHVLTMRVLRLLLSGTAPERILCLTYTKAAASEMASRVFSSLANWVTASNDELKAALVDLLGRSPSSDEMTRARTLFAYAIETPGGLKVQTIHAFCERLLQRFPLEASVPPGFSILDDDQVHALTREAIDTVLGAAAQSKGSALARALATAIPYASDTNFDDIFSAVLNERAFLDVASRLMLDGNNQDDGAGGAGALRVMLCDVLGVRRDISVDDIERDLNAVLDDGDIGRLADALSDGTDAEVKKADKLRTAIGLPAGARRIDIVRAYLLTKQGTPAARLMTKGVKEAHSDVEALAVRAQDAFVTLSQERSALAVVDATAALVLLACEVMQHYDGLKAQRAGLDYEDLIEKTSLLLSDSENTEWVLYKLDGGIDHILVDESQDTGPKPWKIIEALASEFFAGEGASENVRTVFAVGDEKQSIYSFQGAAPEMFSRMGWRFATMAQQAESTWRRVPLNVSFRTVPSVLEAVDGVFLNGAPVPGIRTATDGGGEDAHPGESDVDAASHIAARVGRAGLVEVWPVLGAEEADAPDVWSAGESEHVVSGAEQLAENIADKIARWLAEGEKLVSEDRPIRAGDILILVRKRQPFAGPMVRALKARGIPVAGADRLNLLEQIAVKDLVALGDFLVLPEDDLALACVLKSPMFGFDEDDLFAVAHGRRGTLWKALLDLRARDGKFELAADVLLNWRKRADFMPPFEFFSDILVAGGMRQKLLARLGSEASEPLDEFLALMLQFDESAPPSLSGFLHWLRSGQREVKRDMDQGSDEVRVMTVHGAKGLEAPVVFLPDTCPHKIGGSNLNPIVKGSLPDDAGAPGDIFFWKVKGAKADAIKEAEAQRNARDAEEYNRLLYVAMTRARDRLYVCGFEGKKGRAPGCWYDRVFEVLERIGEPHTDEAGRKVLRLSSEQTHDVADPPKHAHRVAAAAQARPDWALRPARVEQEIAVPLAPSKLAPYDVDEAGEPMGTDAAPSQNQPEDKPASATRDALQSGMAGGPRDGVDDALREPAITPARSPDDELRFLRGTLTHALLEHLPSLPRSEWEKSAMAYVDVRARALGQRTRTSIVDEAIEVLTSEAFGPLFGPDSQAEVNIAADIENPSKSGPPLRLSGMIDRLAVIGDDVYIVDYKTNRPPPTDIANVADAYIYQLAAYRLALREIYRDKTIRGAILWTHSARLMEIPQSQLETYGTQLWELVGSGP